MTQYSVLGLTLLSKYLPFFQLSKFFLIFIVAVFLINPTEYSRVYCIISSVLLTFFARLNREWEAGRSRAEEEEEVDKTE